MFSYGQWVIGPVGIAVSQNTAVVYYLLYGCHPYTIRRTCTFDPDPKKMIFCGLTVCPSKVILSLFAGLITNM